MQNLRNVMKLHYNIIIINTFKFFYLKYVIYYISYSKIINIINDINNGDIKNYIQFSAIMNNSYYDIIIVILIIFDTFRFSNHNSYITYKTFKYNVFKFGAS